MLRGCKVSKNQMKQPLAAIVLHQRERDALVNLAGHFRIAADVGESGAHRPGVDETHDVVCDVIAWRSSCIPLTSTGLIRHATSRILLRHHSSIKCARTSGLVMTLYWSSSSMQPEQ